MATSDPSEAERLAEAIRAAVALLEQGRTWDACELLREATPCPDPIFDSPHPPEAGER